jgi:hypothetical protein
VQHVRDCTAAFVNDSPLLMCECPPNQRRPLNIGIDNATRDGTSLAAVSTAERTPECPDAPPHERPFIPRLLPNAVRMSRYDTMPPGVCFSRYPPRKTASMLLPSGSSTKAA